jgi:hypothetical protein
MRKESAINLSKIWASSEENEMHVEVEKNKQCHLKLVLQRI